MDVIEIFACILLGMIAIVTTVRMAFALSHQTRRYLCGEVLRHVVYPRLFRQDWILNPTRAEFVLCALHWAATGFCNLYRVQSLSEAGLRAGSIALVHLVPLLAIPHLSLWSHCLGLSLDACQNAHRALGYMVTAQGIFHAMVSIRTTSVAVPDLASNLVNLVSLTLLAIVPLLRQLAYEIFLLSHLPLALVLGVGIWNHIQHDDRTPKIMLWSTAACFIVSLTYRYARQLYYNITLSRGLVRVASLEPFGPTMILKLELSRRFHIEPGQYFYLRLLTIKALSFAQRHPFAIVWWEKIDESLVSQPDIDKKRIVTKRRKRQFVWLMIDPQKGWTRSLVKHMHAMEGTAAWLDGPYGVLHRFQDFGCVLLFASGTGIFALLPYVKRLTELAMDTRATTRRIKLVWYTREYHDQVKVWMQRLLDDVELDIITMDFTIHCREKTLEGHYRGNDNGVKELGRRLKIMTDIPAVHQYVQLQLSQPRRSLAVIVSAFDEFRRIVREEVLVAGRDNIRFFELDYQPVQTLPMQGGSAA